MTNNIFGDMKNVLYVDRIYSCLSLLDRRNEFKDRDAVNLSLQELRLFSQNGEDGVLHALISILPIENKFFVEFGVGDGWSCNCRILAEVFDWNGVFLECDDESFLKLQERYASSKDVTCLQEMLAPENINEKFSSIGIPKNPGVMVIDIDGQDFWIWQALENNYNPDILIIEYNSTLGLDEARVEKKGTSGLDLGKNWGASFKALVELGKQKGYTLVHAEMSGVNLFFVRNELIQSCRVKLTGNTSGRSPNWGLRGRALPYEALHPTGSAERELVNPF